MAIVIPKLTILRVYLNGAAGYSLLVPYLNTAQSRFVSPRTAPTQCTQYRITIN